MASYLRRQFPLTFFHGEIAVCFYGLLYNTFPVPSAPLSKERPNLSICWSVDSGTWKSTKIDRSTADRSTDWPLQGQHEHALIGCPSICKSPDYLSAHLLIFILAGKHDRFENVDMSTCQQIWLFSACGRPGTIFYVGPPHGNLNPLSSPSMILSRLPHQDPARKKDKKETSDQKKRWQMNRQTCKAGTEKDKKWKFCKWQICCPRNQKIDRWADHHLPKM